MGAAGLLIIVFSTVTTTFLDALSAGISSVSISPRISEKWASVVVAVVGTAGAVFFPMDDITGFLYLIGSVFAPMIAVQIADYFILGRRSDRLAFDMPNLCCWLAGFLLYRFLMRFDIPVGNTVPDMILTVLLCLSVSKFRRGR